MILDVVRKSFEQPFVEMTDRVYEQFDALREFMFERVYRNPVAKGEEQRAKRVIEQLFEYYLFHTEELAGEYTKYIPVDGTERAVADYIAGMTDNYAIREYMRLFVPKSWMEITGCATRESE